MCFVSLTQLFWHILFFGRDVKEHLSVWWGLHHQKAISVGVRCLFCKVYFMYVVDMVSFSLLYLWWSWCPMYFWRTKCLLYTWCILCLCLVEPTRPVRKSPAWDDHLWRRCLYKAAYPGVPPSSIPSPPSETPPGVDQSTLLNGRPPEVVYSRATTSYTFKCNGV